MSRTRSLALLGSLALLALTLGGTGCRTNHLPEYLPRIKTNHVVGLAPAGPEVSMGGSRQRGVAGLVSDIASIGLANDVHRRVTEAAEPGQLLDCLEGVFGDAMAKQFSWTLVPDGAQTHDVRTDVIINRYGVRAASIESQVYYFVDVQAQMIYVPENRLIWEYHQSIDVPIKPVHVYGPGAAFKIANTAVNWSVLQQLGSEELHQMFSGMAEEAGMILADQMRWDSIRRE